jgi:hypothetical protein
MKKPSQGASSPKKKVLPTRHSHSNKPKKDLLPRATSVSRTKRSEAVTEDLKLITRAIGEVPYSEEESIKTFADWCEFVALEPLIRPNVPTPKQWENLSEEARENSRTERGKYNSAFDPILTESRVAIKNAIISLITVNRRSRDSAYTGAVVRGMPTVGKTTLIKYIGKIYHAASCTLLEKMHGTDCIFAGTKKSYRKRYIFPETGKDFIPVTYISLRSPKKDERLSLNALLKKLCIFYGIPHDLQSTNRSEDNLIQSIIDTACNCKTSLFIIDEISNIDPRFVGSKAISDTIKDLMNYIPATFVFAGIDVEAKGIFIGHDMDNVEDADNADSEKIVRAQKGKKIIASSQMYHRLIDYELLPFNGTLVDEAKDIIEILDEEIALINHKRGDLVRLFPYIMQRTNGFIGAIVMLIRLACDAAITDGTEKLTETLLETIKITRAAEDYYKKSKQSKPKKPSDK